VNDHSPPGHGPIRAVNRPVQTRVPGNVVKKRPAYAGVLVGAAVVVVVVVVVTAGIVTEQFASPTAPVTVDVTETEVMPGPPVTVIFSEKVPSEPVVEFVT